jgi:ribosome-associated protein
MDQHERDSSDRCASIVAASAKPALALSRRNIVLTAKNPLRARKAKGSKSKPSKRNVAAKKLHKTITTCLEDAKALDLVSIDIGNKTPMADFMIVASGRSQRHVGAVADQLAKKLKSQGYGKAHIEGMPHCDWVLIDAGDVVVHIFKPEVREFYNLERLWSVDAPEEKLAI